jgi:hypothetical protein
MVKPIMFNIRFAVRSLDGVEIPKHLEGIIQVGTVMTLVKYEEMDSFDPSPFEVMVRDGFFDEHRTHFSLIELASLLPLAVFDKVTQLVNENYETDSIKN